MVRDLLFGAGRRGFESPLGQSATKRLSLSRARRRI